MTQPEPLASGDLQKTPFAGLLASIKAKQLSGSLVIAESQERRHAVAFRGGFPYKARLSDSVDLVGELLVEAGSLAAEQLQAIVEHAQTSSTLFGQTALSFGVITPDALMQALVFQTLRRVARLFSVTTGTYGFYQEDFLANFGDADSPPVDSFAIITAGVRSAYSPERLAQFVNGLETSLLSTEAEFDQLEEFHFNDGEFSVAMALGAARSLAELIPASGQPPHVVHSVVHCLQMTNLLTVVPGAQSEAPAPPIATPASVPGAPVVPPAVSPAPPISSPPSGPGIPVAPPAASPVPTISSPPSGPGIPVAPPAASPVPTISSPPSGAGVPVAPPSASPAPPLASPVSAPAAPAASSSAPAMSSSPAAASAAPPPASNSNEPKSERRIEAEKLIEKGDDATYFELLGAAPNVSGSELQKAYIARARQFHPDRATGDLADLRPQMADLFARISVAHQTLKDPEKRKEYEATLDFKEEFANQIGDGGAPVREEEIVAKMLEADEAFMKAKIFMKRNKLEEALEHAKTAVESNPDQGDYAALLAWIEARQRNRAADITDLIERLKKAVETVPKSEDAHFYLAQLHYQAGNHKEALRSYEEVMDLNQHNIDAVRMVRILKRKKQERKKKQGPAKGSGGFFGSLFGDSKKK